MNTKDSHFNNYSLFLSSVLNSPAHLDGFSYSFLNTINTNQIYKNFNIESLLVNFNNKDIQLLLNENMLFNNDNLNLFYQSTSNLTKENKLRFYSYLIIEDYCPVTFKNIDIVLAHNSNIKCNNLFSTQQDGNNGIRTESAEYMSLFK
jgi:hypothetical protein